MQKKSSGWRSGNGTWWVLMRCQGDRWRKMKYKKWCVCICGRNLVSESAFPDGIYRLYLPKFSGRKISRNCWKRFGCCSYHSVCRISLTPNACPLPMAEGSSCSSSFFKQSSPETRLPSCNYPLPPLRVSFKVSTGPLLLSVSDYHYISWCQDSLLVRSSNSWSKGCEFEFRQKRWENFLLQS